MGFICLTISLLEGYFHKCRYLTLKHSSLWSHRKTCDWQVEQKLRHGGGKEFIDSLCIHCLGEQCAYIPGSILSAGDVNMRRYVPRPQEFHMSHGPRPRSQSNTFECQREECVGEFGWVGRRIQCGHPSASHRRRSVVTLVCWWLGLKGHAMISHNTGACCPLIQVGDGGKDDSQMLFTTCSYREI